MGIRIYQPVMLQSPTWTTEGRDIIRDTRTLRTPGTTSRDARTGTAVSMTGSASSLMTGTTAVLYTDAAAGDAVWQLLARRVPLQLDDTTVPALSIGRFVTIEVTREMPAAGIRILQFTWEAI